MPLLHPSALPLVLALSAIPAARAHECPPLTPDITIPVPENASDAWGFIQFGHAIARSGDRVIVGGVEGGLEGTGFGKGPGFATVFTVDGSTWTVEALRLAASNGAVDDGFGASVAMDGTVAVIGAPHRNPGAAEFAGTAYIFTRSGSTWSEAQMLTAPSPQAAATFGRTVALSGNLLAIGAPYENDGSTQDAGAVHVFRLESGTWTHRKRLIAPSPQAIDRFGTSVAMDGTTLVVGCPRRENGSVADAGAVFVYDLSDSDPAEWTLQDTLVAPDPLENQQMGAAVAILDDVIAAGAPLDSVGSGACHSAATGVPAFGAVHVFRMDGGSAVHEQRITLLPPTCNGILHFGASLSLASGRIVVGAFEDGAPAVGLGYGAFVFDHTPVGWLLARQLQRPTGGNDLYALFGAAAIFMGNEQAIIGARNFSESLSSPIEGRVYTFDVEITDCNENGLDDCVEIFACLVADCNGNGIPDCCDIAEETSEDVNQNGVPDECDAIYDCGASPADDCNRNGMPDACERSSMYDVVFVLDESGSVYESGFELQKDTIRAAICGSGTLDPIVDANGLIRVAVVTYNTCHDMSYPAVPCECDAQHESIFVRIPLTPIDIDATGQDAAVTPAQFCDLVDDVEYTPSGAFTVLSPGMFCALDILIGADNAYRRQVVIMGDTLINPSDHGYSLYAADLMRTLFDAESPGLRAGVSFIGTTGSCDILDPDGFILALVNHAESSNYRPCAPRGLYECGTDVEELHAALRRVIIQDLLGCPGVPQNLCNDDAPWLWDCNGNGIADCVDILARNSLDEDDNGVPDECEDGSLGDCPYDIDGDHGVGFTDLLLVLSNWGPCYQQPIIHPCTQAITWRYSTSPPQSIADCIERYGYNPANLAACIEAMILAETP